MDTGEAASAAAPGALGVLNPCAQGPRHLHAGYSTALVWSAEMERWWLGQAEVGVVGVGVVVVVAEAAAALGEGQSAQSCSLSCVCLQG